MTVVREARSPMDSKDAESALLHSCWGSCMFSVRLMCRFSKNNNNNNKKDTSARTSGQTRLAVAPCEPFGIFPHKKLLVNFFFFFRFEL